MSQFCQFLIKLLGLSSLNRETLKETVKCTNVSISCKYILIKSFAKMRSFLLIL